MSPRPPLPCLTTGSAAFDRILGGGIPVRSVNVIAGEPGAGKTLFSLQMLFALARQGHKGLYFTTLSEPTLKLIQYMQQFTFFDDAKLGEAIRFVNLSQLVLEQDLGAVLDAIIREVEAAQARVVVVDSFRTVVRKALSNLSEMELQGCVQRLALGGCLALCVGDSS